MTSSTLNFRIIKVTHQDPLTRETIRIFIFFINLPNNIKKIFKNKDFSKKKILDEYFGDPDWPEVLQIKGGADDFDFGEEAEEILEEKDEKLEFDYINYVTDVQVNYEDSIEDLMKKIYIVAGIPIYRQHLFIPVLIKDKMLNASFYSYRNMQTNRTMHIDPSLDTEKIAGIYTDPYLVTNKDDFILTSQQSIYPVKSCMKTYGNSLILWDLKDHTVNLNSDLFLYTKDEFIEDSVYYGLIKKYYPMLSKLMFQMYLKNEKELQSKYPLIYQPRQEIQETYALQDSLFSKVYKSFYDEIAEMLKTGEVTITHEEIEVSTPNIIGSYKVNTASIVNIRNIIDLFSTSKLIPVIESIIVIDGYKLKVAKKFKYSEYPNTDLSDYYFDQNITFRFVDNGKNFLDFIIYSTGDYKALFESPTESLAYRVIYEKYFKKYLNPIIDKINENNKDIFNRKNFSIKKYTGDNFADDHIIHNETMVIKWNKSITKDHFKKYDRVVNELTKAKIVTIRDNLYQKTESIHLLKYILGVVPIEMEVKGDVPNFVLKKNKTLQDYFRIYRDTNIRKIWDSRYIGGILNIENMSTNVRFTAKNCHYLCSQNLYRTVLLFIKQFKGIPPPEKVKKIQNIKKKMEELDPDLYTVDMKDGKKYARVCQKKFRPIGVYTADEIANEAVAKKSLHEFINYTTKEPIYYECPKKMDNLGFIVGKHPKGYCIPKCKEVETEGEKSKIVNELCQSKHIVNDEDIKMFDPNNIVKFGRVLNFGRFSYVHNYFYAMFKINKHENYLLQNITEETHLPLILLEYYAKRKSQDVNFIIDDIISKLNAETALNIYTENNLELEDIRYIITNLKSRTNININWLNFIQNIIYVIYDDIIIYFDTKINDFSKEILTPDVADFQIMLNNFINVTKISVDNLLIIVNMKDYYYPVVYHSDIANKYEETFVNKLTKYLNRINKKDFAEMYFNSYTSLEENEDIVLQERYILDNIIFCVIAKYLGKLICIGVIPSSVTKTAIKDNYDIFKRKNYNLDFKATIEFITNYIPLGELVFLCDQKMLNKITKTEDLPLCNFIGVRVNNTYCWFNDTNYDQVTKITGYKDLNIEFVNYDIDKVNSLIKNSAPPTEKFDETSKVEYFFYIYILFKMEFISSITQYFHKPTREKIDKVLKSKISNVQKINEIFNKNSQNLDINYENTTYDDKQFKEIIDKYLTIQLDIELIIIVEKLCLDPDTFSLYLNSLIEQRCLIVDKIPNGYIENTIFIPENIKYKIAQDCKSLKVISIGESENYSKVFYKDKKLLLLKSVKKNLVKRFVEKYKYTGTLHIFKEAQTNRKFIIKNLFKFKLNPDEDIEITEL